MVKTIRNNWLQEFKNELQNINQVCIVSPFITDNMVRLLLKHFPGEKIQVITRYNLNEFRKGVSSLAAIERLLKAKAEIKSVKNLHSKLYLFDEKSVIITSANFTNGGFFTNKEFGVLSDEINTISESKNYFSYLWSIDPKVLGIKIVKDWKKLIKKSKPISKQKDELPDYGVSHEKEITKNRRYFIKFFGRDSHRAKLSNKVKDEVRGGCSHFALSFSRNKKDSRPKRYNDGDIVFMARMTDTYDYAIFGRAIAIKHNRKRDVANKDDIKHVPWLKDWPILVRVKSPVFIDSSLDECPKMNQLINDLDYESFQSTLVRHRNGEEDITPKQSLMQKGDVTLSELGAIWIEEKFNTAIKENGAVSNKLISKMYHGKKI